MHRNNERAWEQRASESWEAYEAFLAFPDLGPRRTVKGAAEALGKSRSLVAGWASRHEWRRRARAWDQENRRRDEVVARAHRDELISRQLHRAEMVGRVGLAVLRGFVRRDAATGEIQLSADVKPRDVVSLLRLATEIEDGVKAGAPGEGQSVDERLEVLDERELEEFIALAQERAGQRGEKEEEGDDPASEDQEA